jgi:uncharacterized protein YceH (UPF0502 family)
MSGGAYYAGPNPPSAVELRVLGALIEKRRTTPDAYPLSVNSLRLACNQSTNRDPVVDYDEHTVLDALEHLGRRGWTRLASGAGSRARKYRHLFDEAMELDNGGLALLAVLMLRGPQTPGELKQRTERLHPFVDLAAIEAGLDALVERELVARLPRRPGQKEQRYVQLLDGGEPAGDPPAPQSAAAPSAVDPAATNPGGAVAAPEPAAAGSDGQLADLERRISHLEDQVAQLRDLLGA